MHERDRIYLDVPYAKKDQAKALGARWDPHRRQWWAPPDSPSGAFSRWVDPEPRVFGGPPIGVRVVQLPERCWSALRPVGPLTPAKTEGCGVERGEAFRAAKERTGGEGGGLRVDRGQPSADPCLRKRVEVRT
jgi:hypothetical protein